jgi:peptidoglycan L-alanyl-D-glutamate endopeptidase CwlK
VLTAEPIPFQFGPIPFKQNNFVLDRKHLNTQLTLLEDAMSFLAVGSSGPDVKELQQKLEEAGFSPGLIDGDFGLATEAAVINFPKHEGLSPDGVVGPLTAAVLGLPSGRPHQDITGTVTVRQVSKMCPGAPLGNIKANLPPVLDALKDSFLGDKLMVLMAIATIRAETGAFEPISEFKSRFNTSPHGHPFDLLDKRRDLGNRGRPDGANFRGRGFVQLTGRFNYEKYDKELSLGGSLVNNPESANDPVIAAKLLAMFLKDKEDPIRAALHDYHLPHARKLVNGGIHGLQAFTDAFNTGNRILG